MRQGPASTTTHIAPRRPWLRLALALLLALLALAVGPHPVARALNWEVNNALDTADGFCGGGTGCSLRDAIASAGSGDIITFKAGITTITLPPGRSSSASR